MLTLAIRTDKPEAELFLLQDDRQVASIKWTAHRQLGVSIHQKISEMLLQHGFAMNDVRKIYVYRGPGSFTGLRIGVSVANALSYGMQIPIVGGVGESWIQQCSENEAKTEPVSVAYGSDPHITQRKK